MGLSTAERNRQKRERKKRAKEEERKRLDAEKESLPDSNPDDVEIEYVAEPLLAASGDDKDADPANGDESAAGGDEDNSISAVLRRFQARTTALVSDDEKDAIGNDDKISSEEKEANEYEDESAISKRKLRDMSRPTVAELKNRVDRADLVEAHDVTSKDPDFLLFLKSVRSTVSVPRHWGRKRKYLQGKRGIEKGPFQLPDFIAKTGISEVRNAIDEDEGGMNAKRKNRNRVAPKMGALDVDYRTLYDAFFKHQNKFSIQEKLTGFGDLYYEGKEFETQKSSDIQVGGQMTERLRDALVMSAENSPPPWLINMQRYGPPPSYPNLKIPGLNAPLPAGCSYGYHVNGWGKPSVDPMGRPLFGGNPFDPPGNAGTSSTSNWDFDAASGAIVTSDGKTVDKKQWGALPMGNETDGEESSSEEEESSDEESMVESEDEEGEEKEESRESDKASSDGAEGGLPASAIDLRKPGGDETPAMKQLYTVLHQTSADKEKQSGAVFVSDVKYVVPGTDVPEGAESVLSKAPLTDVGKRKRGELDDEDDDLGKKFKF